MQPGAENQASYITLQQQITGLSARFDQLAQDITEIKQMLRAIEERVRLLETYEAKSHPLLDSKLDTAWRRLDEHSSRLKMVESEVSRLEQGYRVIAWLGGILGSTVVVWLITQILAVIR